MLLSWSFVQGWECKAYIGEHVECRLARRKIHIRVNQIKSASTNNYIYSKLISRLLRIRARGHHSVAVDSLSHLFYATSRGLFALLPSSSVVQIYLLNMIWNFCSRIWAMGNTSVFYSSVVNKERMPMCWAV